MSKAASICLVVGVPPASLAPNGLDGDPVVSFVPLEHASPAQVAAAPVALVWDFRWQGLGALLTRAPRLRWVHAGSAGVEHLLPALAARPDIVLTNSTGVFERPIAEYVLGLVLRHAKGFGETAAAQAHRRWAYRETASIEGSTMVVVGAGRIGTAIARLAAAAGMRVIGVRRRSDGGSAPPFDRIVGIVDLPEVVSEADFVAVATPATDSTRHLIDARILRAMRRTAYLVNVGRASAVDTDALVAALHQGAIAGAALDVFEEEPLPASSPLWTTPNLFVSPHMSGDADNWGRRILELFATNLAAWRAGRPLDGVVDRSRGY